MLTKKITQPSDEWCIGFDAGYQLAEHQVRTLLLARLEPLQSDVRLGLRPWSCEALLEEIEMIISTAGLEEELPHE